MTRSPAWLKKRVTADASAFARARKTLVDHYDSPAMLRDFQWPEVEQFNWALHWFDLHAADNDTTALSGFDLTGTWRDVSYDSLSRASDDVAIRLRDDGLEPGDRVLVDSPSCCELWAVLLGILKCGAVCVPIHHGLHPDSLGQRLDTADADLYLTTADTSALRNSIHCRRIDTELVGWENTVEFVPGASSSADAAAFGCFTSGTTGQPKLALHSHRTHGIAHLSSAYWNRLDEGRRHLNISSPGWAKFFWSSLLVPFTCGATIVIRPDSLTPQQLTRFLVDHDVESVCAPVSFLRSVDTSGAKPSHLDDITSVGEAVGGPLRTRLHADWGIRVREGFGQTEATAILGELRCAPTHLAVLPGYQVRLADDPGWPASRLLFRSFTDGSFLGYLRDGRLYPPVTDLEGWQWTGDYADGDVNSCTLRILGRGDDVFRTNGHLISPTEVENLLESHDLVLSAAVVPVIDKHRGTVPHVVVSLAPNAGTGAATAVLSWLNERLPPEVDAASIHVTDELPRSINGKVQRRILAASYTGRS